MGTLDFSPHEDITVYCMKSIHISASACPTCWLWLCQQQIAFKGLRQSCVNPRGKWLELGLRLRDPHIWHSNGRFCFGFVNGPCLILRRETKKPPLWRRHNAAGLLPGCCQMTIDFLAGALSCRQGEWLFSPAACSDSEKARAM